MFFFIIPITLLIAPVLSGESVTRNSTYLTSTDSNEEPLDVQNHPNFGLLPTECGVMNNTEASAVPNTVVGGNVAVPNELPWMVLLSYNTAQGVRLGCVGTLINERYVLTAAQCVTFLGDNTLMGAILGEYDVRTDPDCEVIETEPSCNPKVMMVAVGEVIPHPGYSVGGTRQAFADDIALIRLSTPANFKIESVGPLCLPVTPALQSEPLDDLPEGLVAGWNLNGFKLNSPVPEKHLVSTISNEECQFAYNNTSGSKPPLLTNKHVCVKSHDGGDDPGGPLLFPGSTASTGSDQRYVQHGIVSFGPRFKKSELPEVYTRVAYYMKWILDNLKN